MKTIAVNINSLQEMQVFAEKMAKKIKNLPVFLIGPLGSGKTTFVRYFALALPGGENAEIASPSFTLCNIYPTFPEVLHYDVYRLPKGSVDESLEEALDNQEMSEIRCFPDTIIFIEWADNLPNEMAPANRLEIALRPISAGSSVGSGQNSGTGREVILTGYGKAAELEIFS